MTSLSRINREFQITYNDYAPLVSFKPENHFQIKNDHIVADTSIRKYASTKDVQDIINHLDLHELATPILHHFNEGYLKHMAQRLNYHVYQKPICYVDVFVLIAGYKKYIEGGTFPQNHACVMNLDLFEQFAKRENNSPEAFSAYLKRIKPLDYQESLRRSILDPDFTMSCSEEGWRSICHKNRATIPVVFLNEPQISKISDEASFNELLASVHIHTEKEKVMLIADMKEQISLFQQRITAITHYLDFIHNKAKRLFDDYILCSLKMQIEEFCYGFPNEPTVEIIEEDDHVILSPGGYVPHQVLKDAILDIIGFAKDKPACKFLSYTSTVKGFSVEYIYITSNDVFIYNDCEILSLNQVCQILRIHMPQLPALTT